jgi:hypothetical protein
LYSLSSIPYVRFGRIIFCRNHDRSVTGGM